MFGSLCSLDFQDLSGSVCQARYEIRSTNLVECMESDTKTVHCACPHSLRAVLDPADPRLGIHCG